MKVSFAACADRAVGFGAAFLGLALLLLTARHLLVPVATFDAAPSFGSAVPVVASHAVASRTVVRRASSARAGVRRAGAAHAVASTVRRPVAVATARSVRRFDAQAHTHAPVVAPGGSIARVARASPSGALARSAGRSPIAGSRAGAPAGVAPVSISPARAPARVASRENRPSGDSRSHAPSKRGRSTRAGASAAFHVPARFDVRPALVTVSDASVAAIPANDALPTIDVRRRRR